MRLIFFSIVTTHRVGKVDLTLAQVNSSFTNVKCYFVTVIHKRTLGIKPADFLENVTSKGEHSILWKRLIPYLLRLCGYVEIISSPPGYSRHQVICGTRTVRLFNVTDVVSLAGRRE